MAKLDGTAKGGALITISEELALPVKLIGTGERLENLQDYDPVEFVGWLFP